VARQLTVFERATEGLPGERSLANSAAVLRHAQATAADWVRPGIMVYGSAPDHPQHTAAHWDLRPTMTLRTQVIALQHLAPGDTVGYGNTFTAERALRIGVVACGYADGYPRHAPSGTPVLVDGARTQTVGRVSMDMITVDLSALPHAGVGSEVTLWGRGPRDSVLPIDDVALPAQTVAYELMCALAPRVPVRVA
jgi:alanine racemase